MFLKRKYHKITFIILFLFCSITIFATPADSLNCKSVGGWYRGPSLAVFVVDSLAYIGAGWTMKILNVKDSTNPVLLGEIKLPGFVMDIYVQDTIVYVANVEGGLRIIDASNPHLPVEIGFHDPTHWGYTGVWVKDTLAYVTGGDGLRVIDVSNPTAPVEVGFCNTPYDANRIYIQDTIAYMTAAYDELSIINIADPTSPVQIGFYVFGEHTIDVWVNDTLAFVTAGQSGLRIINVANPDTLFEIGSYDTPVETAYGVWVRDTLAYVVGHYTENWIYDYGKLRIINIANPSSPTEIGSYDSPDFPNFSSFNTIFIQEMIAYITDAIGLSIIDISDPSSPDEIGLFSTDGYFTSVFLEDTLIYATTRPSGLYIINIADASAPAEIGTFNTPGDAQNVYVLDTLAFVADGDSGLCIINVSNPLSPIKIGNYNINGETYSVWAEDTIVYAVNSDSINNGLHIINASNPSSPVEIGFYDHPGYYESSLWVEDTLAYSAGHIIDISNPSAPSQIGSISNFEDIYIKDTSAYLIYEEDFYIYNVSDPTSPVEISRYDLPYAAYERGNIWIQDSLAFVACDSLDEYTGDRIPLLRIINVADPESLHQVGFYRNYQQLELNRTVDVCVKDSLIYTAFGPSGLLILKYTETSGGIEEILKEKDGFNTINISGTLEINYSVPERQKIKIEIFNILGQKLACPLDAVQEKGNYSLSWKGQPGIYFIWMRIGSDIYKKKALLIN